MCIVGHAWGFDVFGVLFGKEIYQSAKYFHPAGQPLVSGRHYHQIFYAGFILLEAGFNFLRFFYRFIGYILKLIHTFFIPALCFMFGLLYNKRKVEDYQS